MNPDDSTDWCRELYEARAAQLLLYGRALGLSHAEAEDVVQETFMALLQRESRPDCPDHYCLRSFRNRALNYRRSLWRRLTREFESRRWFEPSENETEAERAAMRSLQRLPADQREVLVLKIWHQYTFEEIGAFLEIPANTAAGRYRYGIEKLKRALKGTGYERHERTGAALALLGAAEPLARR